MTEEEIAVREYLDLDWQNRGLKDGETSPSINFLNGMRVVIKEDYIKLVDRQVKALEEQINQLKIIKNTMGKDNIIVETISRIDSAIEICKVKIQDKEKEIALAKDFKGLVVSPLEKYQLGYISALQNYVNSNL